MQFIKFAFFAMLALQACCSSDNGNQSEADLQGQTGDRRLAQVRTTYNSGRVDVISYTYDAQGFRRSYLVTTDTTITSESHYFLGEDGLVDYLERDDDADGLIDTTVQFQYADGRLSIREYDYDQDQVPDTRQRSTFDSQGRFTGLTEFELSPSGEELNETATFVVSYPDSAMVVSERDYEPLGSPDVRVEYMTLPNGEITSSIETYYGDDESTSVTQWIYEDGLCDRRWQGAVYTEGCVESPDI